MVMKANIETWEQVEKLITPVGFNYSSEFWGLSEDPRGLCVWEHWDSREKIAVDEDQIWDKDNSGDPTEISMDGVRSIVKMYRDTEPDPMKAETLGELCEALNKLTLNYGRNEEHEFFNSNKLSSLPTFGGEEPENTEGIFSWDEENFLIYVDEYVGWKLVLKGDY